MKFDGILSFWYIPEIQFVQNCVDVSFTLPFNIDLSLTVSRIQNRNFEIITHYYIADKQREACLRILAVLKWKTAHRSCMLSITLMHPRPSSFFSGFQFPVSLPFFGFPAQCLNRNSFHSHDFLLLLFVLVISYMQVSLQILISWMLRLNLKAAKSDNFLHRKTFT